MKCYVRIVKKGFKLSLDKATITQLKALIQLTILLTVHIVAKNLA